MPSPHGLSGAGARSSGSAAIARTTSLLVKELVEAGKYRPVIDRTYTLDEVVEATRYVETGQKTGNVVLRVAASRPEPVASHEVFTNS